MNRVGSISLRSRTAFTLVEILCVIVLLAIVAAIVLPGAASADESGVAASAARTLMADLLYAQSRAISTHACHYVVFDSTNDSYSVQFCSGASALPVTDPETSQPMNSSNNLTRLGGATITQFNVGPNAGIVFDAMGIPYAYSPTTLTPALYEGLLEHAGHDHGQRRTPS